MIDRQAGHSRNIEPVSRGRPRWRGDLLVLGLGTRAGTGRAPGRRRTPGTSRSSTARHQPRRRRQPSWSARRRAVLAVAVDVDLGEQREAHAYVVEQKVWISSALPGSCPANWLQGKPTTEKPGRHTASAVAPALVLGVSPHFEATFTTRRALSPARRGWTPRRPGWSAECPECSSQSTSVHAVGVKDIMLKTLTSGAGTRGRSCVRSPTAPSVLRRSHYFLRRPDGA